MRRRARAKRGRKVEGGRARGRGEVARPSFLPESPAPALIACSGPRATDGPPRAGPMLHISARWLDLQRPFRLRARPPKPVFALELIGTHFLPNTAHVQTSGSPTLSLRISSFVSSGTTQCPPPANNPLSPSSLRSTLGAKWPYPGTLFHPVGSVLPVAETIGSRAGRVVEGVGTVGGGL